MSLECGKKPTQAQGENANSMQIVSFETEDPSAAWKKCWPLSHCATSSTLWTTSGSLCWGQNIKDAITSYTLRSLLVGYRLIFFFSPDEWQYFIPQNGINNQEIAFLAHMHNPRPLRYSTVLIFFGLQNRILKVSPTWKHQSWTSLFLFFFFRNDIILAIKEKKDNLYPFVDN